MLKEESLPQKEKKSIDDIQWFNLEVECKSDSLALKSEGVFTPLKKYWFWSICRPGVFRER